MKKMLHLFLFSFLFIQTAFSQGWEQLYSLPDAVKGATSVASEGYGVHLVGVYNNTVKHFWLGNDNTVVWSTLSAANYSLPQVTVYDGQVIVVMKNNDVQQPKLRIYRSENGGYSWSQIPDYNPPGHPEIYNLYAYSDKYGTHITWDNNPNSGTNSFQNEVYYVRYTPTGFVNFLNVTNLTSPSQGGRPKVAVAGNKASVTLLSGEGDLTSRDLNLDTGTWDNFYRFGGSNQMTLSEASIGDMLYIVSTSDVITGVDQALSFSQRHKDDESWTGTTIGATSGGIDINKRNMLINTQGLLHLINFEPDEGVYVRRYDPSLGFWEIRK